MGKRRSISDLQKVIQLATVFGVSTDYLLTILDDAVKEYLRMRHDYKLALKKLKQQISTFALHHGCQYSGTKWTIRHLSWLRKRDLEPMYRETLSEYLISCEEQSEKN